MLNLFYDSKFFCCFELGLGKCIAWKFTKYHPGFFFLIIRNYSSKRWRQKTIEFLRKLGWKDI